MGSEDLFHKRKAKAIEHLERRKAKRSPYDKVLIVCEGEKTEPQYFEGLIAQYKLNSANVAIDGTCGSSPESVFNRSVSLYDEEVKKGDPFDRVYCVFDKDSHDTYEDTLRKIFDKRPKGVFHAAKSIPCFEYWLLLHFQYTAKPFAAKGKSSIGNEVIKELKRFIPGYEKGDENIFTSLFSEIEFAKENAKRSLKSANQNHTDNPSTLIHELVDYLQNIKTKP